MPSGNFARKSGEVYIVVSPGGRRSRLFTRKSDVASAYSRVRRGATSNDTLEIYELVLKERIPLHELWRPDPLRKALEETFGNSESDDSQIPLEPMITQ